MKGTGGHKAVLVLLPARRWRYIFTWSILVISMAAGRFYTHGQHCIDIAQQGSGLIRKYPRPFAVSTTGSLRSMYPGRIPSWAILSMLCTQGTLILS